jgi:hypothetical protein
MEIKSRRLTIRIALIAVWIGLGVTLFALNRGHSLLVDNRSVEALNLRAPDMIKVTVDQGKTLEFFRNDRDIFDVGGGTHRIDIEFSDGTPSFTGAFSLPIKHDLYILSIPKMLGNVEPFFEPFYGNDPQPREGSEAGEDGRPETETPEN